MISPTMMMETEVDTDTDTVEDSEDKHNIYEEVLNNETFRMRNNHSKLSATSSIYRASWWGRPSESHSLSFQVRHLRDILVDNCRTTPQQANLVNYWVLL